MGTVTRVVESKFFDGTRLYYPGETIEIDEDLLTKKKRGTREGVPGLRDPDFIEEVTSPTPEKANPRKGAGKGAGKKAADKVEAKDEAKTDETAEDVQVEEGGTPRDGGSSLLG